MRATTCCIFVYMKVLVYRMKLPLQSKSNSFFHPKLKNTELL